MAPENRVLMVLYFNFIPFLLAEKTNVDSGG